MQLPWTKQRNIISPGNTGLVLATLSLERDESCVAAAPFFLQFPVVFVLLFCYLLYGGCGLIENIDNIIKPDRVE